MSGTAAGRGGGSLRAVVTRALGWQSLSTVVVQVAQTVITLVLAALVAPEQFALWGIAAVLYNAQHLIGSFGVAQALIYHDWQDRPRDTVDAAFLFTAVLGLVTGGLVFAAAPALGRLLTDGFAEGEVTAVVQAMSVVFVFATMASAPQALIERTLDFRRRALPEIAATIGYVLLAAGGLLLGFGVWSLIVGRAVQSVVLTVLFWALSPIRPRLVPRLRLPIVRALLSYGKFVTAAGAIGFAVGNLDTIAVGRLAGAAALGAYALAFTVTNLVPTFLTLTLGKVFFPVYAGIRDDAEALRRGFATATHSLAIVMLPTTVALAAIAPAVLVEVFGSQWEAAGTFIRILALYGLARSVAAAGSSLLAATGRPQVMLWAFVLALAIPAALTLPLAAVAGGAGVAWAFTAGQVGAAVFALLAARPAWSAPLVTRLAGPAVAALAALVVTAGLQRLGALPGLVALTVFAAVYGLVLLIADRPLRDMLPPQVQARLPTFGRP